MNRIVSMYDDDDDDADDDDDDDDDDGDNGNDGDDDHNALTITSLKSLFQKNDFTITCLTA